MRVHRSGAFKYGRRLVSGGGSAKLHLVNAE